MYSTHMFEHLECVVQVQYASSRHFTLRSVTKTFYTIVAAGKRDHALYSMCPSLQTNE